MQDLREPFLAFQAACSGPPCQGSRGHGSSKPVPASPVRVLPECCCPHCPGSKGNRRAPRVATGVMWVQSGVTPRGHRRPAAALPGTLALPQTPQLPALSPNAAMRLRPTPASGGRRLPSVRSSGCQGSPGALRQHKHHSTRSGRGRRHLCPQVSGGAGEHGSRGPGGRVPPPCRRVQVPVATQDVRLSLRHVEALGREDGGGVVSRAPNAEEAALVHTSPEAGAGPHPITAPATLQRLCSPGRGAVGEALWCSRGTWTAQKRWLWGGREPGSSPGRVWERPSFSMGTSSPDSLDQALLGHKGVEEAARGAAPAPEPFVCCPVGPEAQRWQKVIWAQRVGAR